MIIPITTLEWRFMRRDELGRFLTSREFPKNLSFQKGRILIYALCDSLDRTVRYVGVTNDRERRLAQHRSGKMGNHELKSWIQDLNAKGGVVEMMTLGYAGSSKWQTAERNWIWWFRSQLFWTYNVHEGGVLKKKKGAEAIRNYARGLYGQRTQIENKMTRKANKKPRAKGQRAARREFQKERREQKRQDRIEAFLKPPPLEFAKRIMNLKKSTCQRHNFNCRCTDKFKP